MEIAQQLWLIAQNGKSVAVPLLATIEGLGHWFYYFQCQRCGKCCDGQFLPRTYLQPREIYRLATTQRITKKRFKVKHTHIGDDGRRYMEQSCPFYKLDVCGVGVCTIYSQRPEACQLWPCEQSNGAWLVVSTKCPASLAVATKLWETFERQVKTGGDYGRINKGMGNDSL